MDFLKSAVASAISKGPPFPYSFGDRVDVEQSTWTLYNGTRREDNSACSIFSFDALHKKSYLPLARNALRKMRTIRHPGVVRVLDTVETDTYIYIATERVTPLRWFLKRKSMSDETIKWGLFSIAQTMKFINEDAASVHGYLRSSSIYTSESGEWRVGGFDLLSSMNDDAAIIYSYGSVVPDSGRYSPPEVARSGWDTIKKNPITAVDSYSFGTLVFEAFNGDFAGGDQVGQTKNIPPSMHSSYKRLVNSNPKSRLSIGHFLDQGRRSGGFFETPLINLTETVDNLGVKTDAEREEFLNVLEHLSGDFPEEYLRMKVLPELLKSVEFGGGGPQVLTAVMKIASKLADDDFDTRITPIVVRLFSSPDRALRVCLLDNLPLMINRLPQRIVSDKIFPQMVTGFTDAAPLVREQTVKAVLTIIGKLSDRTINGELLKYLAKTSNDEQPGIRTNTTICLGKIAKNLGVSTRSKVLVAAFSRSLRDPFVHSRHAALMALAATADVFSDEDCASRILPVVCPALIDKEKIVRDQANKTIDLYLQRVRKSATSMPDTVLPPPHSSSSQANTPRMGTPQPSDDTSWTGWAISSFTNKVAAASGEIEPAANGGSERPSTAPNTAPNTDRVGRSAPIKTTASASTLHRQAVISPSIQSLETSPSSGANEFFHDADAGADNDDAWGEMGDMDEDKFEDAESEGTMATAAKTSGPVSNTAKPKLAASAAANPFDTAEPDFAGWLAAQSQRKPGAKALPKGLAKPAVSRAITTGTTGSGSGVKKVGATATVMPQSKQIVPKKISTTPKVTKEDEDGWGDGW